MPAYRIKLIRAVWVVSACALGCGNKTAGTGAGAGGQASGGSTTSGAGGVGSGGMAGTPGRGGTIGSGGSIAGGSGGAGAGGSMGQGGSGGSHSWGGRQGSGGTTASGGISGTGGAAGTKGSGGAGATGGSGAGGGPSGPVTFADAAHVRLLPGSPFFDRQQLHRQGYLAAYSTDKLLYPYRQLAKLAQASGVTSGYAGWDTGFLVGHMTGHYLSAASRMSAATGDSSFATKANYVVGELAKCQTALNENGYLAAFPSTVFDWLEGKSTNNNGIVVPYYTVHKIMAGLLDAYHYLGNQQALTVATKVGDYFQARLAGLSSATIEKIFRTDGSPNPQNEFGAMSDVYSDLYTITGQQKYLDTAKLFNRSWFITPLAAGQDNLSGLHANCHIAEALGIAHTANISGDTASRQASESFWKLLTSKHAFVIGGDSFHEWLDKGGVEAGPSLDSNASLPATTAETCNTHNMLKLTAALFERSPQISYADYYERALYNHILASVAPDTGNVTYFTPLHGNFRTYINGTFCDNGTGMENTARYNEGIYFEQGTSLWVNLYIPSQLTWDATGLTIQQQGNAAAGDPVTITITGGGASTNATLNLRIPSWTSGAPAVAVNGTAVPQSIAPSTYLAISRSWKVGDTVTLSLPEALRLEHAQDVSSMVAVFLGPIVLAGELGNANMPNDFADKDAYLSVAPVTVPTIANSSTNPADWLQPVANTPLAYQTKNAGAANGITFRPLYEVHHERYSVYWPLQTGP